MKVNKHINRKNIANTVLFAASPFFAIPGILLGLYNKRAFNLILLALFYGILQYLYVSTKTRDIYFYYTAYDVLIQGDPKGLGLFVLDSADSFMYFLMYALGAIGLPAQALFFCITTFSVGTFLFFYDKFIDKNRISKYYYLLGVIGILFALSYNNLFSGMRFYFAVAISLHGLWNVLFKKRRIVGIGLLVLASFTHFGMIPIIPISILLWVFPDKPYLYKIIFYASLVFLFIPLEFIVDLMHFGSNSEQVSGKIDGYTSGGDMVETAITGSLSGFLLYTFKQYLWFFVSAIYLGFTMNRESLLRNLCVMLFSIVCLTFQFEFISYRYSLFYAIVLFLLIVYESIWSRKKFIFNLFVILNFLGVVVDVIVLRYDILRSWVTLRSTNIISILMTNIGLSDFI